jgi:hypothetical protein
VKTGFRTLQIQHQHGKMTPMERHKLNNPHDLLARRFLCNTEWMAELLQRYLKNLDDQQIIALLDLTRLVCKDPVTISDRLVEGRGDLRFSAAFKGNDREASVCLFFEHQSTKVSDLRFRGLKYIVQEYDKFRELTKGREKFPYPILICLYHGNTPWTHVPEMDELIEIIPGMQTGLLKYTLILIDISPLTQDEFVGHPVLQVVLEMLQLALRGELAAHLDRVMARLTSVSDDPQIYSWLSTFAQYVLSTTTLEKEQVATKFSKAVSKEGVYDMVMTTAEKLFTDGKIENGRDMVLQALQTKFKTVPMDIERAINQKNDLIVLKSLLAQAIESDTLEEFADGL